MGVVRVFRLAGIGVFGFAMMLLWIYCVLDVIASEESLIRNLPKTMWLIIVIFVPTVGAVAWLGLGRPLYAGLRPGDTRRRQPRQVWGPDDDPDWRPTIAPAPPAIDTGADERERRLREREAELDRRERELRRQEGEGTDP